MSTQFSLWKACCPSALQTELKIFINQNPQYTKKELELYSKTKLVSGYEYYVFEDKDLLKKGAKKKVCRLPSFTGQRRHFQWRL